MWLYEIFCGIGESVLSSEAAAAGLARGLTVKHTPVGFTTFTSQHSHAHVRCDGGSKEQTLSEWSSEESINQAKCSCETYHTEILKFQQKPFHGW